MASCTSPACRRRPRPPGRLLARCLNLDSTLRISLSGAGGEAWRQALVEQGVRAARLELGENTAEGLHLEWLR